MPFLPNADAAILTSSDPLPTSRPQKLGPVYDPGGLEKPIEPWCRDSHDYNYPKNAEPYATASIPERPMCNSDRYLRATLARDERLRLSILWYYTRDILNEIEFLSGLQEKVRLAQEAAEWEFAVIGFLDVNYYTRMATVGLPLGILPRGETICAHTVNQPPGSVFLMPNMLEDWRFKDSPYVESGRLHAYAGAPLRLQSESGETVALGSLCVASGAKQPPLNKSQQRVIAHLADWIVSDLVQCTRVRRQRVRRQMADLIATAQAELDHTMSEEPILNILNTVYPDAMISLKSAKATHLEVEGRAPLLLAELEDGVWEDTDYIDDFIAKSNCFALPDDRVVRILAANFESSLGSSMLVVASNDFRLIFDDIDLWFVQTCASMISQAWHKRLLNEAIQAKDEFLRGFSHQLRTPIHGILGCVELLTEELLAKNTFLEVATASVSAANSGTPYEYLSTIKTSGRDLITIINSMITLNRWAEIAVAERSYNAHSLQQVEIDLAEEVRKMFSDDSRYRPSVFFNRKPSLGGNHFQANNDLLRASLLPLIANAIQNTPEGVVLVTISLLSDSRELVVDIQDTGNGILPEHQDRIFEPYEKVGEHSTGAGLGLTIASKFAGLHNGFVELISSAAGRGSHFRATFRDLQCEPAASEVQILASTFDHLPSKFHYMPFTSEKLSPSEHLITMLTQFGFTSSNSMGDDCFLLVDDVPDSEQRRQYLSQLPPSRVAVCLSPASGKEGFEGQNLVYIQKPYYMSTITDALAEADRLLKVILATKPEPTPSLNTALVPDEASTLATIVNSLAHTNLAPSQPDMPLESEVISPVLQTKHKPASPRDPVSSADQSLLTCLASSKFTVLLVDDNPTNLRFLQMYCQKRKLAYISAKHGRQAIDIYLQHQQRAAVGDGTAVQLVFMDLQMPVCDGLEATMQIRLLEKENGWTRSSLFIVTGQDSPTDRDSSKAAGADGYLVKPVSLKLLDRNIYEAFSNRTGS